MIKVFRRFRRCDSGATGIDWAALTAALLVLSVGLIIAISSDITALSNDTSAALDAVEVDPE